MTEFWPMALADGSPSYDSEWPVSTSCANSRCTTGHKHSVELHTMNCGHTMLTSICLLRLPTHCHHHCISAINFMFGFKLGFHYPSSQAEFDFDGPWTRVPVNSVSKNAPEFTGGQLGPWTRVVKAAYFYTPQVTPDCLMEYFLHFSRWLLP